MKTSFALPALAAIVALALTGCVDNSTTPGGDDKASDIAVDKAAQSLLPAKFADNSTLIIATDAQSAPNEFKDDNGVPVGWGIELATAISAKLGLTPDIRIAKFESIIPRIVGGQVDVGQTTFLDTVEREKQVDFVNYYSAGTQWASRAGEDVDPDNACGLKVAVQSTTFQETVEIPARSEECVAAGKPAIEKMPFDTQDAAVNAVVLGQADALSAASPVTFYAISLAKDKLQAAGETADAGPYGIAVAKDSGMAEAVQAALQSLVDDGTYLEILTRWGVEGGAVNPITINAASQQ